MQIKMPFIYFFNVPFTMGPITWVFLPLNLIAILYFQIVNSDVRVDPLVQTTVGFIRGVRNEDYSMFLGIPYAKVDPGNPFGFSSPYPEFQDIFEANDDSAECPQISGTSQKGTLDCLHLNVHVPNSAHSGNLLPVLIYIHGGGFTTGSGAKYDAGPKFLIQHDIILVTVNYRLGTYGFMCLDNSKVPGNQGLRDQKAAIQWVKENIKAFGGDDTKITIMGESAGSASVDLQLLVNKDKIFSKVIMQSGTSLSPWVVTAPDYASPLKLAKYFGLDIEDENETEFQKDNIEIALEFLAAMSTDRIVKATSDLGIYFGPCIEKQFDNVDPFLTNDAVNSISNLDDTSILIGSNEDESRMQYAYQDMAKVGNIFYRILAEDYDLEKQELENVERIVRHFYINDAEINNDVKTELIDFDSDSTFQHPTESSARQYKKNGANVYRYVFSYKGERNYLRHVMNLTEGGAIHSDEMGYLFDMEMFDQKPNQEDQRFINRMTTMWANFAKYGEPTPNGTSEMTPVFWPAVTDTTMPYLVLDAELTIKNRPFSERMAFWDLLFEYLESLK